MMTLITNFFLLFFIFKKKEKIQKNGRIYFSFKNIRNIKKYNNLILGKKYINMKKRLFDSLHLLLI